MVKHGGRTMRKRKYKDDDDITMIFCGTLGIISAIMFLGISICYEILELGLFMSGVMFIISMFCYYAAYTVVRAKKEDREFEKSDFFEMMDMMHDNIE
jgi:hypothetical protein